MRRSTSNNALLIVIVIAILSLGLTIVLFGILESTGAVEYKAAQIGGAGAGWVILTIVLFRGWGYVKETSEKFSNFNQQIIELARHVAQLYAKNIVKESDNQDKLKDLYNDKNELWPSLFWNLDDEGKKFIHNQFRSAILFEIQDIPELKSWKPPKTAPKLVTNVD